MATVRTRGLKEFIAKADAAGKETKKAVRDGLRDVGRLVQGTVRELLAPYDAGTARKVGVSVRKKGLVEVVQRHPKVTGKRGDYGALQMRKGFLRALEQHREEVAQKLDEAVERLIREHNL